MFWHLFLKLCYSYALLFFPFPKDNKYKKWVSSKTSWLMASRNYWNCQTWAKGRRPTRTNIFLSASSGLLKGEQGVNGKKAPAWIVPQMDRQETTHWTSEIQPQLRLNRWWSMEKWGKGFISALALRDLANVKRWRTRRQRASQMWAMSSEELSWPLDIFRNLGESEIGLTGQSSRNGSGQ